MVRKPGEDTQSSLTRGKRVAAASAATPASVTGPRIPAVRNNPAETPLPAYTVPTNSESPVAGKNNSGTRRGVVVNGAVVELSESVTAGEGKSESGAKPKDGALSLEKQVAANEKRPVARGGVSGSDGRSKSLAGPLVTSLEAEAIRNVRVRNEALHKKLQPVAPQQQDGAEKGAVDSFQVAAIDKSRIEAAKQASRVRGLETEDRLKSNLDIYREQLGQESLVRTQSFGVTRRDSGNETYEPIVENDFIVPELNDKEKRLSTISVDVDTASYSNMRRFLNRDQLPPANSVRIEELVNYFKYDYAEPEGNEPFSVKTELATCPWQPNHRLAMVGLKAKTIDKAQRPPTNLVFLLDVSGSMRSSNKLPLVQQSMRLLVEEMTEDDRISIVTYASNSGVRLESTLGSKKAEILNVINGLRAGGSTNGEGGIRMAYDQANRHYFQGGANRVILCSDGDFNVGKSSDGELVELIQEKAASGVFLSVFGFGMGNLKDGKLEKLADKGNGHYGYIDNVKEAQKVFQDELVGTLYTVAKDVKLQVEFNPATVGAYRLIGYENRKLAAQDFTDDTKDAGEIGSGHTVTALYEIIPKDILLERPRIDGLKYQSTPKKDTPEAPPLAEEADDSSKELFTVKLRYKKPDEEVSTAVQNDYPVQDVAKSDPSLASSSDDLVFAASVASFGMNLRGSKYRGNWGFAEALESAQGAPGKNDAAQRAEFIQLVQRAMRITGQQVGPQPRTDQAPVTRPGELGAAEARIKAAVGGKYRRLVKKIEVRDDFRRFGAFSDYGHWDGTEYAGHKDLLPGHWVYVYPNWYIWADSTGSAAEDKPAEKGDVK
jgi:secreted protein with Ig-like and vWFA domain